MVTLKQLRDLKRSEFEDAADGWGDTSNRASSARDRVDNEMLLKIRKTQKGEAADTAAAALKQLSSNYQYIHAECGLIRTALNGLASELGSPQRKLKDALADAESLKFTVNDDGSVHYETKVPLAPDAGSARAGSDNAPRLLKPTDANQAKAEGIADAIADERIVSKIKQL
ncbi:hypothetical protein [Streptomyces sp. H27-D2]|uniref:hypothetical protein n=1 Tax=Streptomyces sp. H27-D2 TaxID=3046304 RepID=UPI002DB8D2F8|nr:hypothetical protein [Streptomyces sp. H27-D2]MEC4017132.1 hypothetical protein [Streptomyces sp. H27-D2]